MQWLADNALNGYFVLGFAAVMLAGVWWIQKQLVYLVGAAVSLILLGVFWLVIHNVPTTAMRMETDMKSLGDALVAKEHDKAARYVDAGFKYNRKDFDDWYEEIQERMTKANVDKLEIDKFEVKSHDASSAKVEFELEAKHKGKAIYETDCECNLTRDGDVWRLTKISLHKRKGKS